MTKFGIRIYVGLALAGFQRERLWKWPAWWGPISNGSVYIMAFFPQCNWWPTREVHTSVRVKRFMFRNNKFGFFRRLFYFFLVDFSFRDGWQLWWRHYALCKFDNIRWRHFPYYGKSVTQMASYANNDDSLVARQSNQLKWMHICVY